MGFFDPLELNGFLVEANLHEANITLYVSLYFLANFFKLELGLPC